jgi:hypothetical protein
MYGLVGHGTNRVKDDFYATPDSAIYALLERETFEGDVWEPACGDGAISEKLIQQGYDVYSSDLVDRGYGNAHFDFLNSWRIHDNIITNPPFNIGTQFTLHALMVAKRKVAIFNKLTFLEGKERKQKLFSQKLLKNVYVFSERQAFQGYKGGMLAFAWYVFDKSYYGDPTLYFI